MNPMVHYPLHMSPSLFAIVSQANPVNLSPYFVKLTETDIHVLTSLAESRRWCVPVSSSPSWCSWSYLMAYSKATLKATAIKLLLVVDYFEEEMH